MSESAELIYFAKDDWGELRVFDDGQRRLLSFGPGDEQSACLKADPARLVFSYTQAMLLALLFSEPRKALCLGLGAGSLATALHKHCKGIKITAVELRQSVIEIAKDFFYLPQGKRLLLHCADAQDFVAQDNASYDLILSDLYTAQGLAGIQSEPEFLSQSAARLKAEGLLVINCWRQHQRQDGLLEQLARHFAEIRGCETADGNWLLFAFKQPPLQSQQELRRQAESWSQRLGYSLSKYLKQLEAYQP